jgi:hypothetical protein
MSLTERDVWDLFKSCPPLAALNPIELEAVAGPAARWSVTQSGRYSLAPKAMDRCTSWRRGR